MGTNSSVDVQSASEEDAIFERQLAYARRLSTDAIARSGVPEGPLVGDFPIGKRWNMTYQYLDGNLVLNIELRPQGAVSYVFAPLTLVVLSMVGDLERLLADPSARKLFKISSDEELENSLYNRTLGLSISYIEQLPGVLFHAFTQASIEAIIGDVKKMVEPMYKYEDGAEPKILNLLPNNELSDILRLFPKVDLEFLRELDSDDRSFSHYRKGTRSGRKVWLTTEAFENLSDAFEALRNGYKVIKKDYKAEEAAYIRIHRKKNSEGWKRHWEEYLEATHPGYIFSPNDMDRTPSELAYRHLSRLYDYSEKTMERKVIESRRAAQKRKHNMLPNTPIKPKIPPSHSDK